MTAFIVLLASAILAQGWLQTFPVQLSTLATDGESTYFVLKPGFQATFQGGGGKLVVTVLHDTIDVGGVKARVVEEREWKNGELVEVSRNFFAMDPGNGDVYYFGEDVDACKKGEVVTHDASWRRGDHG